MMLVPEAWQNNPDIDPAHKAMYEYLASVMEPWDGPAALAMTDGRWAVAGVDRNALRPLRYSKTSDNLLIIGSETGMVVVPESQIIEKGRLGPGQMIAVDLDDGTFFSDKEIKDKVSSEEPYAERVKGFQTGDDLPPAPENSGMNFSKEELIRRQTAAGHTLEDMEMVLAPMVEDAKEAIGSMGDDTPLAVISLKPRQVSHFLPPEFLSGDQSAN